MVVLTDASKMDTVTITNCTAWRLLDVSGSVRVEDSTVVDCTVTYSTVTLAENSRMLGCTVRGNYNDGTGGRGNWNNPVYDLIPASGLVAGGDVLVSDCVIADNTGDSCCWLGGNVKLINSQIVTGSDRRSAYFTGNSSVQGCLLRISCNINGASASGCTFVCPNGGISSLNASNTSMDAIKNCIIQVPYSAFSIKGTSCLIWPQEPDDITGLDGCTVVENPWFMDADAGDFRLHPRSAAVDAGNNAYVNTLITPTDLTGAPRIQNGTVDLGAYEFDPGTTSTLYAITYADASAPDDLGFGNSVADAKQTIQAAINQTKDGGIVYVADGTYGVGSTVAPDGEPTRVVVERGISLRGTSYDTIIDGTDSVRGVYVAANSSIDYMKIQNGRAANGGALFLNGSASRVRLYDSSAVNCGGGAYVTSGGALSSGFYAETCSATFGGGAYIENGASTGLGNRAIECSASDSGGGVYFEGNVNVSSAASVYFFRAEDCDAMKKGGGVYCDGSGVLSGLDVTGNEAAYGGGIYAVNTQIRNSRMVENAARTEGGGVYAGQETELIGCTIAGNRSLYVMGYQTGGGLCAQSVGSAKNCIIWGNTSWGQEITDNIVENGTYDFSFYNCCFPVGHDVAGVNNVFADPQLTDTYMFTEHSSCINAGDNSEVMQDECDLSGNDRIRHDTVDIGCYESAFARQVRLSVYVNGNDVSGVRDGASPETGYLTIQEGLDAVDEGGTVYVAEATYSGAFSGVYNEEGTFLVLTNDVTVCNVDGGTPVIDGQEAMRCVYMSAGTLRGFSIINGYCSDEDSFGGGVYMDGGRLDHCSVTNCSTSNRGGGGIRAGDNSAITDCIVSGCSSPTSGGMYCAGTNIVVSQCLVADNTSSGSGGIYFYTCTADVVGCTIANNRGAFGINPVASADTTFQNCIIAGNTNSAGTEQNFSGSAQFSHVCMPGSAAPGCINVDPYLNADYTLAENSPCINAGENASVSIDSDLAGNVRIQQGIVDIGCFESSFEIPVVYVNGNNLSGLCNGATPETGFLTIQDGIAVVDDEGTVFVVEAVYSGSAEGTRENYGTFLILEKDVTVCGYDGGTPVIDGRGAMRGVYMSAGTLRGFSIINGSVNQSGFGCGGGVYMEGRTMLDCCVVSSNSASAGGGIYCDHGTNMVVSQCLVVGNSCEDHYSGGGISFNSCAAEVCGCTIADNFCTGSTMSAGVWLWESSLMSIRNSIIAGNVDGEGSASDLDYYGSAQFSYVCVPGVSAEGCINQDPDLNADYTLAESSPCVNAGDNAAVTSAADLAGAARIQHAVVDIGCYESVFGVAVVFDDADDDGIPDEWERQWFGDPANCDPNGHGDGDRFSNLEEYIAGTCPTNSADAFMITNQLRTAQGLQLQWGAVSGRVYAVEWTDSLTNDFRVVEGMTNLTDSACTIPDDSSQGFYRLKVGLE